jgi:hypothetical protein
MLETFSKPYIPNEHATQYRLYLAIIDGNFNEVETVITHHPELASKPFNKEMPRLRGYNDHHTPMLLALHCLSENNQNFNIVTLLHKYQASFMQLDAECRNPLMIILLKSTPENFRKLIALLKPEELKAQLNYRSKGNNVLSFTTSYLDREKEMLLELADLYSPEQLACELSFVNANKQTALTYYGGALDIVHRELAACAQIHHKYEEHGFGTMAQRTEKAHAVFAEVVSEYLKKLKDIHNTSPVVDNGHFIVTTKKFEAISQYFDEALRQLAAWDVEKILQDPLVKTFKEHMRTFESKQLAFRKEPQLTYHRHESKIRQEYNDMLTTAISGIQACELALEEPNFDRSDDKRKSTPILNQFVEDVKKRKEMADGQAAPLDASLQPAAKEHKTEPHINYKLANR